nr:hypothetical protein GCM10020093_023650 [Planobispora longispora]
MGDHVHIDGTGHRDGFHADAARAQPGPAATRRAQHQLGGVDAAGEVQQRACDVPAHHLVVGAAQGFDQSALAGQMRRAGAAQAAARPGDVHRQQVGAPAATGDAGRPPDQRVALRTAGQRDHDPLAHPQVPAMPCSAR